MSVRLGPVDQPTASEMTCFANNIGRIRVNNNDDVPSSGPLPKCAMHQSVHVWTVLASDDFRISVHRVSVGVAFTGDYPDRRSGFLFFDQVVGRFTRDGDNE